MNQNGSFLAHYGVLGMKWGIRRYENPDGTLTEAGKKRYSKQGKYTYTSAGTHYYEARARLAGAKGDSEKEHLFKQRSARSREIDAREEEYARRVDLGKHFVARILSGGVIGGKGYVRSLAISNGTSGDSKYKRAQAFVSSFFSAIRTKGLFTNTSGAINKALYVRQDEDTFLGRLGKSSADYWRLYDKNHDRTLVRTNKGGTG